jgi:glucose/arabinose dehydrogenase
MTGLVNPWDIAFTPDGAMLYTEKCRGLSARFANGTTIRLFGTTGSALVASDLFCEGQSGVHGVAVDPDFANGNRYVYVFMASNLSTNPRTNRVVRLSLSADNMTASSRTDIITDIAYKDVGNAVGGPGSHSGGRIRFGPDRFLYVTTGDNHNATLPQDLQRLGGKVLRVDRDGVAAPGNNTPAGGDPRIFTYGHRNVQGITFRPASQPNAGQPFTAEHGPNHSDEITALIAGGNAGWDPQNRPGLNCQDKYCGYAGNPATMPMTDTGRFPNAMRPSWVHNTGGRGVGPATFLDGNQWKAWNGRLLVSIMNAQRITVLQLDAGGMTTSNATVDLPAARSRSLVQGPDGNLYVATDGGEIWRVVPS